MLFLHLKNSKELGRPASHLVQVAQSCRRVLGTKLAFQFEQKIRNAVVSFNRSQCSLGTRAQQKQNCLNL